MNLNEALSIVNSKVKDHKVVGYWIKNGVYIFNMPNKSDPFMCDCSFYKVYRDGTVEGTNPALSGLMIQDMKRI